MWSSLIHRRRIDDVLQVLRDVGIPVVTQLLDYFEAVEKGAVVLYTRFPLRNPNCVVYTKQPNIFSFDKVSFLTFVCVISEDSVVHDNEPLQ